MTSKKLKLIYWLATGFVVFICLVSAVQNILITDKMKEINLIHGFNLMMLPFFGVLKLSGLIAILVPMFKRLKEAAYHGFIFYFIGATYINIIDGSKSYVLTTVILIAVIISYTLSKKLDSTQSISK